jgi:hypothetical protein
MQLVESFLVVISRDEVILYLDQKSSFSLPNSPNRPIWKLWMDNFEASRRGKIREVVQLARLFIRCVGWANLTFNDLVFLLPN